ncbi:MAG: hypothetical protein ACRDNW_19495 [Trebonia sp.]
MGTTQYSQYVTRDKVSAAFARAVTEVESIAGGGSKKMENSRTICSDSCGDLIVNLAAAFLRDPGRGTDDVIAEHWADLEPDFFDGFEVWNQHVNDLGDYCPWSGRWGSDSREALMSGLEPGDDLCPQGCRASALEDPPKGSGPYKAAIVATVKGWISGVRWLRSCGFGRVISQ